MCTVWRFVVGRINIIFRVWARALPRFGENRVEPGKAIARAQTYS